LGGSLILWLLPAGEGRPVLSGGVTIFTIVSTLVILKADKGVVSGGYRLKINRNSDCWGTSLYRAISGTWGRELCNGAISIQGEKLPTGLHWGKWGQGQELPTVKDEVKA
jgi:hypothetical protein